LRHGSATVPPIVEVKLFKEIPPNTKVRLLLSGVKNPAVGSYSIFLKIIQKLNRISTILNTATATSPALVVAIPPATCAIVPSYSESRVGFLFDMTITPCLASNVVKGSFILI